MNHTYKLIIYVFTLILFGVTSVEAYTEDIATQTARETWWYFKQVIKDPYVSQYGFSVKTTNNQWITNVTVNENGYYTGMVITDSGLVAEVKFTDSSEILDWAFVDEKLLVGGFSFRIPSNTIKVELLTNFLGAKFINEQCVGQDFSDRSIWPQHKDSIEAGRAGISKRYYGGEKGFANDLSKLLTYPPFAREIGLKGNCYVTFLVKSNGQTSNIKVVQSIGAGTSGECFEAINNLRGFKANDSGETIFISLPIKFTF